MPPKRGRGRGRGAPPGPSEDSGVGPPRQSSHPSARGRPPGFSQAPGSGPPREITSPSGVSSPPAREPPREAPKAADPKQLEQVGLQLEFDLALTTPLPRKPKPVGNRPGRPIKLISNCYSIDLPRGNVYHYDVEIINMRKSAEPEKKKGEIAPLGGEKKYRCMNTKRNREVVDFLVNLDPNFKNLLAAFDGRKNLYTRKPLNIPSPPLKCIVKMPSENPEDTKTDDFVVHIQPVNKKDTKNCIISLDSLHALFEGRVTTIDQDAVMAVETILRHRPCQRYFPVGRSFFYPPAPRDIHPLGGGKEIWFGYHQSLRLGQWKPMVNLDITATTFYSKGPVLNFIEEILNTNLRNVRQLSDADCKRIGKELKNMRVEATHLTYKRKYRVLAITKERADRLEFPMTVNGQTRNVTVAAYFKQNYRALEYPHLPCLQVNPVAKKIYLPIEVCNLVEGQHCKKKLEDRQNAEMIKFTARAPDKRFSEIKDLMRRTDYTHDNYLQEFGMKVYNEPLKLEGRVIGPPSVRYNNESKVVPRDGSWDMRDKQFYRGAEIEKWVFLSFGNPRFCSRDHMEKFAKLLVNIGRDSGIRIGRPELIDIIDNRRVSVPKILKEMKDKYQANLAVIAVPSSNKTIYAELKQAAETILGLSTQCVKDDNVVKKCNPPLVSNLIQKINAKMGGVNNSLTPGETPAILRRPVIIIGADVNHPSPGSDTETKYSLAAAVGSLDAHPSRYAVSLRSQRNRDENKKAVEVIKDLDGMVKDLLVAFFKSTGGKKPEKIIFYRDGVSEGEFEKVKNYEVNCIRRACLKLQEGYEPGITFIVVQKRHHIRFMPQDGRDGVGKMRNIPPGTTVDNTVVHPLNFDFFLCSQFGLQGTSRPCHYTVIEDDNSFTADDLHKLTYYLCHTYVRCTKSISSPAPVMYAHLAAFRARQHLLSQMDESSAGSTDSSSAALPPPAAVVNAIKVQDSLLKTMYYV